MKPKRKSPFLRENPTKHRDQLLTCPWIFALTKLIYCSSTHRHSDIADPIPHPFLLNLLPPDLRYYFLSLLGLFEKNSPKLCFWSEYLAKFLQEGSGDSRTHCFEDELNKGCRANFIVDALQRWCYALMLMYNWQKRADVLLCWCVGLLSLPAFCDVLCC